MSELVLKYVIFQRIFLFSVFLKKPKKLHYKGILSSKRSLLYLINTGFYFKNCNGIETRVISLVAYKNFSNLVKNVNILKETSLFPTIIQNVKLEKKSLRVANQIHFLNLFLNLFLVYFFKQSVVLSYRLINMATLLSFF